MRETPYYSVRAGRHPTAGRLDFDGLKELVLAAYLDLRRQGYFQEVLGTDCVDGDFPGSVGEDVAAFFFRSIRKRDLWPIEDRIATYLEDDLFDVVELLHDCASKGVDGTFHSYAQCGMHYETFEQKAGRNDFRVAMNPILGEYTGISILPIGSGPLYTNTPLRTPDFFSARYSAPNSRQSGAALDGKPTGAAAFRAFLRHRSTRVPFLREASLHSAARQPAGTGSAQILRNMSPNSRRVRCPSASRSQ